MCCNKPFILIDNREQKTYLVEVTVPASKTYNKRREKSAKNPKSDNKSMLN